MKKKIFVLIPAAGVGARFGHSTPKQYVKIDQLTILEHVIACFEKDNFFSGLYIAISESDAYFDTLRLTEKTNGKVQKVIGGETRQDSVFNLLNNIKHIARPDDWVLVHDAARPTLSLRDLHQLISSLENNSVGGLLAKPISSTVKLSKNHENIHQTLDRDYLWEALTPQMFRYEVLYESMQICKNKKITVTDESQAVELYGLAPKIIEAKDTLLKLTHSRDFSIITGLLMQKEDTLCV